ncbi:MAG: transposase [Bdellovibrionales bacterium]
MAGSNFDTNINMPRRIVELSDFFPYHICARSNNREWFDLPLDYVYGIYANVMAKTIDKYSLECHGFVLMSNHFHFLATTPKANLSSAMRYFMTESSRGIARASNRINRIYGSRYHWTILREPTHYAYALKYIYRNPIEAKIVKDIGFYRWITINPQHKKFSGLVTSNNNGFDEYTPKKNRELLNWINQCEDRLFINSVQKALARHEFQIPICPKSGKRTHFGDQLHPKETPGT